MFIEDPKEGESGGGGRVAIGLIDVKRSAVGVGARALFYPTLLYNVVRNKCESGFHWWDEVDEFLLLGAVPFPSDVPRLKQLGVRGVVTLNEPYETLVPTSLYQAHGVGHLVIPTRDYLFAPSFGDICQAVDFIHKNASCGKTTYVHCKAGRGRSTTIVLCYLVHHRHMTPAAAYGYVRLRRPRVHLATSQWKAVQEYYHLRAKKIWTPRFLIYPHMNSAALVLDETSIVIVTEADLDGYDGSHESGIVGNDMWEKVSLVYRVRFLGHSAIVRLSRFCLRPCTVEAGQLCCGLPRLMSQVGGGESLKELCC
ncbi:putative dual specificity protein phosphatase DSP8 [Acorus calamus]|uniref:phosphatidylglycerophosphatase n=1 Tax=Acorus calamus TaxID=4465 RepID=A0AAV9DYW5_ACOCL|nr:putative dual specificity protein phosphatase DSP8 [Acorus calamus]